MFGAFVSRPFATDDLDIKVDAHRYTQMLKIAASSFSSDHKNHWTVPYERTSGAVIVCVGAKSKQK